MTTGITIETTKDNITKQQNLSYINPLATTDQLKNFAESLVALSNQTYVKTIKVDRVDCDAEETYVGVTGVKIGSSNNLELVDGVFTGTVPANVINNKKMFVVGLTTTGGLPGKMFNARPPVLQTEQSNTYITNYSIQRAYTGSGQSGGISLTIGDDAGQTAHIFTGTIVFPASPEFNEFEIKLSITFQEGE